MKVLNLYAGLGGNRRLWKDCDVTAVEMEPEIAQVYRQHNPQDEIIIGDAHEYLLQNAHRFDFIWSSPPCQTHSRMMKATRHKKPRYSDMTLYQEIIFLQHFFTGPWVVENVKPFYEPLIKPTRIIGRHCFWANFYIPDFKIPNHSNFIQAESKEEVQSLKDWLGIQYDKNIYYKDNHSPAQVLRNCVHPETGLMIFNAAMNIQTPEAQGKFVF